MKSTLRIFSIFFFSSIVFFGCQPNPAESPEHKKMVQEHERMEAEHETLAEMHIVNVLYFL